MLSSCQHIGEYEQNIEIRSMCIHRITMYCIQNVYSGVPKLKQIIN